KIALQPNVAWAVRPAMLGAVGLYGAIRHRAAGYSSGVSAHSGDDPFRAFGCLHYRLLDSAGYEHAVFVHRLDPPARPSLIGVMVRPYRLIAICSGNPP
ncbi:MAG: hypothetical protein JSR78_10830, partial [Proteobacteria bacterium]|nr:hypothetical protein [Pseudomonadota bacterium]